jgi:hypothetical protein
MPGGYRPEHNGYDGNHHEPYEPYHYERDHGHYGNNRYRCRNDGYDEHQHRYDRYNDPHCKYDNGNDRYYCRHLHGHYGKHL